MISLSRLKEMVEEEMENKIKDLEQKLKAKEQECENGIKRIKDLEERIINHSNEIEEYCSRLANKEQECEELKKENKKLKHSFKELNVYIEKAQEWLKKQKLNDIFVDEMRAVLWEELKCLKKK